jgi:hypothetical protein
VSKKYENIPRVYKNKMQPNICKRAKFLCAYCKNLESVSLSVPGAGCGDPFLYCNTLQRTLKEVDNGHLCKIFTWIDDYDFYDF